MTGIRIARSSPGASGGTAGGATKPVGSAPRPTVTTGVTPAGAVPSLRTRSTRVRRAGQPSQGWPPSRSTPTRTGTAVAGAAVAGTVGTPRTASGAVAVTAPSRVVTRMAQGQPPGGAVTVNGAPPAPVRATYVCTAASIAQSAEPPRPAPPHTSMPTVPAGHPARRTSTRSPGT
ncbi:hypothetical protein [Phytohabitans rumicis]|uniref:hypothetical protein n=1 Tax=Phytohabitans rumicis TaxID=1076125 RepID=UPI0031E791DC